MKPFRSNVLRAVRTIAAMAFGLVISTGAANAALVTFTVDESAVGGADGDTFQANGITGKYLERVTLDTATGNFTGHLIVSFANYTLNGIGAGNQLSATPGDVPANRYGLYALVSVSGTFNSEARPNNRTLYSFLLNSAQADLYLDPGRNTTHTLAGGIGGNAEDNKILTASTINTDPNESFGLVLVRQDQTVVTGSYSLVFTDPTLVGAGTSYWPTLSNLIFQATATGDVDNQNECPSCVFPRRIQGDTSIAFGTAPNQVPEPASMSLLGLGLLGTSFALRRRRQRQSN